jgi:hypothetical protein
VVVRGKAINLFTYQEENMGKNNGFIMTQKSKSTRKTITKTVVVPPREKGENIYVYYVRLKKLGLTIPKVK